MAKNVIQNVILPAAIIAVCFAGVISLSGRLEAAKPKLADGYTDSDLSMNGSRLKGFSLGMEGLLADWYWVRALQYIGDKMVARKDAKIDVEDLTALNPRLLYPLLENATDLDPHFTGAYLYGAIVLPAIDKQKAIELAAKGVKNNPTEWRIYQYLGFIYWKVGDYQKASETYEIGAKIPGAPHFMGLMAASMKTEGASRSTARSMYSQMLADSDDEAVRITADRRLKWLNWLDQRDEIRKALESYKDRTGRCAERWTDILPMLRAVRLPEGNEFQMDQSNNLVDPSGAPYSLDREQCDVLLDVALTQIPLQ